jgi:hypothetical protein
MIIKTTDFQPNEAKPAGKKNGVGGIVLETNISTPWAYAHASKSIVAHIRGGKVFDDTPISSHMNAIDFVRFLAHRDRASYRRRGRWYPKYLYELLCRPSHVPMPSP